MPRLPDIFNLLAWLASTWLAAVALMLGLRFGTSWFQLHWTTVVYFAATLLFSLIAFFQIGIDKRRAGRGKRRIPEAVLHTTELLGGWPGSLLGQRTFRHKNRKITYQATFWGITGIHLLLLGWMGWMWWSTPTSEPPSDTPPAAETEPANE